MPAAARTRIAGELHDVVAHALSAMTVQATAARRLTLTRPELAREAFAAIETAGREALDDRRRIACELHDLVAHSISAMVALAEGAQRSDPARALEAAMRIERTGRETLGEMRDLLDSLKTQPALAPQPTLADLGTLVPSGLAVRGERRTVAAGLDLAAYRIVQEALSHAGGGPTAVTVTWGEHELALEIRDAGPGGIPRHDACMRERVRLFGGELEIQPVDAGGWQVRATLPLPEAA